MAAACLYSSVCVRPLAGAGIEMMFTPLLTGVTVVRPLAGAGIEIGCPAVGPARPLVRPLTGAGIEMGGHPAARLGPAQVRPLMGVIRTQKNRGFTAPARMGRGEPLCYYFIASAKL